MTPIRRLIGLFFFCFFLLPAVLHAEVIGYLRMPDITGEVSEGLFDDYIAILGFGQSVSVPEGSTRAVFQDIRVIKAIDSTSPLLNRMVAEGTYANQVTLEFTRDGSPLESPYYTIILEDVSLTGVVPSIGAAAGTEMISFSFKKIRWQAIMPDGGNSNEGWDLENNTPW